MAVERVAVVGAGTMGRGIAHAASLGGFRVMLQDVNSEMLENALKGIRKEMQRAVERDRLDEGVMREGLERIAPTESLREAVEEADFVIEAVPEEMELKLEIFGRIDERCPERAVLATNTSTMSRRRSRRGQSGPAAASPCTSSTRRTR